MKMFNHTQLILLSILFLVTSCTSLLEQDPKVYVSDDGIIVDESSAKAALNGVYHQLGASGYYGGGTFISAVDLAGDNLTWTGSLNYYYSFNTHEYGADNQLLSSSWVAIYSTINQANQVIEKVTALTNVSDSEKARIVAEATIIRSLSLFDLARTWGNIPVIKQATSSPTQFNGVKQTPAKEVYQIVINDIRSVYSSLSETSDRAHINQATADALLARVYLYAEDWINAETFASKLIGNSNYELIEYQEFFKNKLSRESIWELAYSSSNSNNHYYYWLSSNNGGRHEWGPSQELVNLLKDPKVGGTRKVLFTDLSTAQVPNYYVGNLYYRTTGDDPAYLFRISEQYLIRAEARAKKTSPDLAGALEDLNAVRQRAQIGDSEAETLTEIIQAIEDENRVEFALEPHRWFDLVRTNRATIVLGIEKYKTLFPIPYSDIQADTDLVQNENY